MTQTLYVDPGHRIPDQEWGEVVRRAEEIAREAAGNKTGGAAPIAAPVLDMRGRSNKHSGVSGMATQLLVLHSAECPLRGGYAQSLTEWAITSTVVASWHRFVDPIARVYMMDDSVAAWHASEANPMSIGWEQAGYARFTREEWLTPDGLLQLNSLAYDMAQVALRDGIPPVWLTTEQVTAITTFGDRTTKGFCLHRQIDPETRTDPGDAYPYELLMATIRQFMNPNAATTEEDFLMALSEAEQRRILAAADRINGTIDQPNDKVLTERHLPVIATHVLNKTVPRGGAGAAIGDGLTSLGAMVAWNDDHTIQVLSAAAATAAQNGGTVDEIKAAVVEALKENLVRVEVSVEGGKGE